MRARPGYCLISADPLEETIGKFGILLAPTAVYEKGALRSRSLQAVPKTGLVVQHSASHSWHAQGEESLTNKRVVFDRWASRSFTVEYSGKEYTFLSVSQWDILAVFDNCPECGDQMYEYNGMLTCASCYEKAFNESCGEEK